MRHAAARPSAALLLGALLAACGGAAADPTGLATDARTPGGAASAGPAGRWVIEAPAQGFTLDAAVQSVVRDEFIGGAVEPGGAFEGTGTLRIGERRLTGARCLVYVLRGTVANGVPLSTDGWTLSLSCRDLPAGVSASFEAAVPGPQAVPATLDGSALWTLREGAGGQPSSARFAATATRR
jgi:hypothetical protein